MIPDEFKTYEGKYSFWAQNRRRGCGCSWCKGWHYLNSKPWHYTSSLIVLPPSKVPDDAVGFYQCGPKANQWLLAKDFHCEFSDPRKSMDGPITCELKTGFNCKSCNFKNDYACANQSDGSYLCFNCR